MNWFHLPINPEPWAIGNLSVGKRGGRMVPYISANPQLTHFQDAVKSDMEGCEPLEPGEYDLYFWFWRRLDDYETQSGRRHRKHWADATNLQKATEDALQGVLFDNDRNVRRVGSEVVEQGPDVNPGIIVCASSWSGFDQSHIPDIIWSQRNISERPAKSDNSWPPVEGL